MDVRLNRRKPVRAGKSARAFNGEDGDQASGHKVRDSTLPRKTSKQMLRRPYPKPTQVDEENIQRRSREHSFRNSAN